MSNPTTPFGWQMPTNTDLVTDLPADFEVFGQAVATSMADLLGGTTGQVLAKNTNADMDFVWTSPNPGDITEVTAGTGISGGGTSGAVTITNSMATAIDAKGDLVAGTGADAFSRLAVGANDTVLTADSTAATGLKWAAPASGGMTLLSTTTLTGATTTISGISGAYNELYVIVYGMTNATANNEFYCYPNASLTGVYYESLRNGAINTKLNGGISLAGGIDYLRTSANNASLIRIQSYASTTYYKPMQFSTVFTDTASTVRPATGSGGIGTNSAITSLQFQALGGNFSTGTVLIYGVK